MDTANDDSSLGILDIDKIDDFDNSLWSSKLHMSMQQIKKKAAEIESQNLRSSFASLPKLTDIAGTEFKKPEPKNSNVTVDLPQNDESRMSFSNSAFPPTFGLESRYFREPIPSFELTYDSMSTDGVSKMEKMNSFVQGSPDLVKFCAQEFSARSSTCNGESFRFQVQSLDDSWKTIRGNSNQTEMKGKNSSIQSAQESFRTGADALKLIEEAEMENRMKNTLEITDGHVFNESQNLINEFSNFTIGENHAINDPSHPLGEPSWGKPGSKSNRPSFGYSVKSPLRETDQTLQDCTMSSVASEVDSYRQFEKNLDLSSYAVPKSSTAVQQNQERRRASGMINSTLSAPISRRSNSCGTLDNKSISISDFIPNERKRVLSSTPNTRTQSPATSESSGSTLVNSSTVCEKPCCGRNLPTSGQNTNSSHSTTAPSTVSRCLQPCCSSGAPSPQEKSTLQLQTPVCQWNVISPSPSPIVTAPSRVNYVTPFMWAEPQYGNTAHYSTGTAGFTQGVTQQAGLCPQEIPETNACLYERVEMHIPVSNPWPMTSIQCQLSLVGLSCNGQTLPVNMEENQLACLWPQQVFTLTPSETTNLPVSFMARYPGKLILSVELRCTAAYPTSSLTLSTPVGISRCTLKCQVEWPNVRLEPENLEINSSKGTMHSSSFFLSNFTAVPVIVTLQLNTASEKEISACAIPATAFNLEEILRIPSNGSHCWLNLSSPFSLTVRLAASCSNSGKPSRAEVPVTFNKGFSGEAVETMIVTHKNGVQDRTLAQSKIQLVSLKTEPNRVYQGPRNNQYKPHANSEFPKIKSTMRILCFPATDLNHTRKQELLLRNVGPPGTLTVSLQTENSVFQLCHEDGNQNVNQEEFEYQLSRDQNVLLTVAFTPAAKVTYKGLLVIKARTSSECNILMKVPLVGYGGCNKLSIHGFSATGQALETNLQTLHLAPGARECKKFIILNKGSRPAFVCVTSQNGVHVVDISPKKFVVLPFSQTAVTISSKKPIQNQTLIIFYGEELLRQAVAESLSSLPRPSLLSMLDASGIFLDEEKVLKESPYPAKVTAELGNLFYKEVSHFDLKLYTGPSEDNMREATMATLLDFSSLNDDTLM